jgi:8-oxo-dGTP diphosphatase
MIHRNSPDRPGDYHAGKWNGLGGKLELNESALDAAQRELGEESGLNLPQELFKPLGVLHFPNFKPQSQGKGQEDWVVWVWTVRLEGSRPSVQSSGEGDLHWVPARDLLSLNLWAGDREFLPRVLAGQPFLGTFWYGVDGGLVRFSLSLF